VNLDLTPFREGARLAKKILADGSPSSFVFDSATHAPADAAPSIFCFGSSSIHFAFLLPFLGLRLIAPLPSCVSAPFLFILLLNVQLQT
jgi:hypothetical protein